MLPVPSVDLRMYARLLDFLAEDARGRESGQPFWREATNAWAHEQLRLEGDELEYFLAAVTRLGGHPWKGNDWDAMADDEDLDRLVWTFHRAWVDRYGPLYPST